MLEIERYRQLAADAVNDGAPLRWFEQLYAAAQNGTAVVPWADQQVNPHIVEEIRNYYAKHPGPQIAATPAA